jgi:hypothetical protein
VKTPLILRKVFENMAAERGSLPLKVGEFTCMLLVSYKGKLIVGSIAEINNQKCGKIGVKSK